MVKRAYLLFTHTKKKVVAMLACDGEWRWVPALGRGRGRGNVDFWEFWASCRGRRGGVAYITYTLVGDGISAVRRWR